MKNELNTRISMIEKSLDGYLQVKNNSQKVIYDAMRYSIFAGGKRLRPILMLEAAKLCGGNWETVKSFACAMEMIHTYSLIHDDLPAMDNDNLRRGIPTSHVKFGESIAILAGDALLNKAFEIVSSETYSNPNVAMHAISILSKSAGCEGMIGGQVIDLESEGKEIELNELQHMHLLKTGAIIRSSCAIGAYLAGGSTAEIRAIDEFAGNLGIAFQIRDDILDVTGTEADLGKPIGSDEESEKNTYVKLCGLERSEELVQEYSYKAKAALDIFKAKAEFLTDLTDYLVLRKS